MIGNCFMKLEASSGDSVDKVQYYLGDEKDAEYFDINQESGDLCTKRVIDREEQDKFVFQVFANDGSYETQVPVTIDVIDQNDNSPVFTQESYVVTIPFGSQAGRTVIQVHANDPDTANNGEVTYWIKNTHGMFEIDAKTGTVRLVASLPDNKQNATYKMEIFAQDHGVTPNIGKAILVVRASNSHNNPPKFDDFYYSVEVDENISGVHLVQVRATDPDQGKAGKINYRIIKSTYPKAFKIDRSSGQILLVSPLDYETAKYHEIVVEVRDEAKDSQFATTVVQVKVRDTNDHAPEILSMPKTIRIPQSVSPNSEIIYTVQAVDLDSAERGNNLLQFSIEPPNPLFTINQLTGQIFALQKLMPHNDIFKIIVRDRAERNSLSSSVDLQIEVYNDAVEEVIPAFTSTQYFVQAENSIEPGTTVVMPKAKIPSGGQIWYNITSKNHNGFAIDHNTGRIYSTSQIEYNTPAESTHHFLVAAYNRNDMKHHSEAGVVIKLSEVSSKCPKFPFAEYFASIEENSPPDMIVIPDLMLLDMNRHNAQNMIYQITEDNSNDNFFVDVTAQGDLITNATLRIKKQIDRERMAAFLQGIYTLTVSASSPRCQAGVRIKILVEDINDNSPEMSKWSLF